MITQYKLTIVDIPANKWLVFYNEKTNTLLCEPFQGEGSYTCADVLLVSDTLEECKAYIAQNQIIDPFVHIRHGMTESIEDL